MVARLLAVLAFFSAAVASGAPVCGGVAVALVGFRIRTGPRRRPAALEHPVAGRFVNGRVRSAGACHNQRERHIGSHFKLRVIE